MRGPFSAVSTPILKVKNELVTRCCAKEERQRGSGEGERTEKKARRAVGGGSRGTSGGEGEPMFGKMITKMK